MPLAGAMAPGVRRAVEGFRPDVVAADQQTLAGALVAERLGVPYATASTTPAEFSDALDGMPKVARWTAGLVADLRARLGDPGRTHDPRFSPDLVLSFTTPELAGPGPQLPQLRYVGPAFTRRPAADFPWGVARRAPGHRPGLTRHRQHRPGGAFPHRVRGRRAGARAAAAGSSRRPRRGVLDQESDADLLVLPRIPQLPLLRRASAMVSHAGQNTVAECLWHGVPLVVAPIRDDQPLIAGQVTGAGAGVRVRFGCADRRRIGAALDAVLDGPAYRAAARRVGDSFRAAGGAAAAAAYLEKFAAQKPREPQESRER